MILTVPTPEMAARRLQYVVENRAHLTDWEPPRTASYYTEEYWRQELTKPVADYHTGKSLHLVMLDREREDGPILGVCNFNSIIRGAFQACYLGYSVDGAHEGQGLMFEALSAATGYVFDNLGLHRIMANYIPTNVRSGRLLRKLGLVVEGYARDYLYIGNAWQDHVLTALTNSKWGSTQKG